MIQFFVCTGLTLVGATLIADIVRWGNRNYPHPQSDFIFLAVMAVMFLLGFLVDYRKGFWRPRQKPKQIDCQVVEQSDDLETDDLEHQPILTHAHSGPRSVVENNAIPSEFAHGGDPVATQQKKSSVC